MNEDHLSPSDEIRPAEACENMAQVRRGVDTMDAELVQLLARRFSYMDAAARIKQQRGEVRDEARKAAVIANAARLAKEAGLPDGLAEPLWEHLVESSIFYEQDVWDKKAK